MGGRGGAHDCMGWCFCMERLQRALSMARKPSVPGTRREEGRGILSIGYTQTAMVFDTLVVPPWYRYVLETMLQRRPLVA